MNDVFKSGVVVCIRSAVLRYCVLTHYSMPCYAGRLPPPSNRIRISGDISYNGDHATSGRFDIGSVVSYVGQQDVNEPLLTVRETFVFAATCIGAIPSPEVSK